MKTVLQEAGYILNAATKIWARPDYGSIAYSDGDENENQLTAIIQGAKDRSLHSLELARHCTSWFFSYHLNKGRANILRPFEKELKGAAVLEVGAGCGALTRYLGELGTTVLALEGSIKRASIARARTKDLKNVTVVADKFSSFAPHQQFDFVILVGVLEYANLFTEGENPAITMLEHVRSLLRPHGKIVIAIENQLGLKYFAGAPEDHLGRPMVGIEGSYKKNQQETFGYAVLKKMLTKAGFLQQHFLAPFPDYKFPVSILTEKGALQEGFDPSAFASQSVRRDPQLPARPHFSLELAWQQVMKNELAIALANSFLIVASPSSKKIVDTSVLAYHYSASRMAEYCKETIFSKSRGKGIHISYNSLDAKKKRKKKKSLLIEHVFPEPAKYTPGTLLSQKLMRLLIEDNWSIQDIALFLNEYVEALKKLIPLEEKEGFRLFPYQLIPGKFFDAVPQNIILNNKGIPILFDQEWATVEPLELGYLLFRTLLGICNGITIFGFSNEKIETYHELISSSLTAAGFGLSEDDYDRYFKLESQIQAAVLGSLEEEKACWSRKRLLPYRK